MPSPNGYVKLTTCNGRDVAGCLDNSLLQYQSFLKKSIEFERNFATHNCHARAHTILWRAPAYSASNKLHSIFMLLNSGMPQGFIAYLTAVGRQAFLLLDTFGEKTARKGISESFGDDRGSSKKEAV